MEDNVDKRGVMEDLSDIDGELFECLEVDTRISLRESAFLLSLNKPIDFFKPIPRCPKLTIVRCQSFLSYPDHMLKVFCCSVIMIFPHANIDYCKLMLRSQELWIFDI